MYEAKERKISFDLNMHACWQVIQHSQSTRKNLGGNLVEHFKKLHDMGPTELDKEIKARFQAWDSNKSGSLGKEEMTVRQRTVRRRGAQSLFYKLRQRQRQWLKPDMDLKSECGKVHE